MSEKVLGLKLGKHVPVGWTNSKKQSIGVEVLTIKGKRILESVSVRLASESVDLKWLEKYVTHIRGCFEKNQPSDFEAGEETGRIEGLEVLLAEAKKEAKK